MAERSGQKTIRRVAAVLILLMGLALVQDRVRLLLAGQQSHDWPTVTGEVVDATVTALAGTQVGLGWRVQISYDYEVDDRSFTGSRLRFSRRLGGRTRDQAEQAVVSYVPGGPIEVHYDPEQPARSVIVPGPDRRAWFGLIVGLGLAAIAVTFWTVPTRSNPSSNAGGRKR
ncbi:DUF3592 domain-containing protein [Wenzhouxiangella limi]|uniref:DUF3592 domain-containing protein n=1 Tax=Wenzhouxiangella limi TaxID=2707351 RepID=A0A845UXL0_9GAMM|nr:DUF3592 domain-containing protein [Wenzhouxiangella limi]NDY95428.1 DUF3592 domain-containing protein [Wenzhouxiangella limi]